MRLNLDFNDTKYLVRAYREGVIQIGDQQITTSAIISADGIDHWSPQRFEDLTLEHFSQLLQLEPELVIVGTGAEHCFPSGELIRPLLTRGIGVEIMATAAACRTFNIVVAEGRRVIAALLMI